MLFLKILLVFAVVLTPLLLPAMAAAAQELSLDNGVLTLKADIDQYGGAITWVSLSGSSNNLINNFDRGRQIQQSYYAGNVLDRQEEGQHPAWSPWAWNPIQVGDAYYHSSEVVSSSTEGGVLYTRTIPKLWDMNNEPAEALMEQWSRLEANRIHVRCRLSCQRSPDDPWDLVQAAHQEMPAVYTISALCNQYTYVGENPWTGEPPVKIEQSGPPWAYWGPGMAIDGQIEGWAANVDDSGWGLGLYYPDAEVFAGGLHGVCGGGPYSSSTTYFSPLRRVALGRDSVLEYEYTIIVGTLEEIRDYVYAHKPEGVGTQRWSFGSDPDTQGWSALQHVDDLHVSDGSLWGFVTGIDPILLSPDVAVPAVENRWVHLFLQNLSDSSLAQLFWTNQFGPPGSGNVLSFATSSGDASPSWYHLYLGDHANWRGLVTRFRLDPATHSSPGWFRLYEIRIDNEPPPSRARLAWWQLR